MAQAGEGQYVAQPPPAYAPPGQQSNVENAAGHQATPEITAAPATAQGANGSNGQPIQQPEQAAEKTAVPHPNGNVASDTASAQKQRMVIPLDKLGDLPADVDCPYCKKVTRTKVVEEDSGMTYVLGGVIALFCICLACLPCCMGAMQNVDHYCSECNGILTHRPYDRPVQVVASPPDGVANTGVRSKYQ